MKEQLRILDLVAKMGEYLSHCKSVAYVYQALNAKLLKQYTDYIHGLEQGYEKDCDL